MKIRLFDVFDNSLIIKRILIFVFGLIAYYRFNIANKTTVKGSKILKGLPKGNVLFVSNHQTYFADVTAMYQVFCSAKWGVYDRINMPFYVLNPKTNIYFIAAMETMKAGLIPKLFSYVGSVSIKRTWRSKGKDVDRGVDPKDIDKIFKAMKSGLDYGHFSRMGGPESQGSKKLIDYQPSWKEVSEYWTNILTKLTFIVKSDENHSKSASDSIANSIRSICNAQLGHIIIPFIEEISIYKKNDWDEGLKGLKYSLLFPSCIFR